VARLRKRCQGGCRSVLRVPRLFPQMTQGLSVRRPSLASTSRAGAPSWPARAPTFEPVSRMHPAAKSTWPHFSVMISFRRHPVRVPRAPRSVGAAREVTSADGGEAPAPVTARAGGERGTWAQHSRNVRVAAARGLAVASITNRTPRSAGAPDVGCPVGLAPPARTSAAGAPPAPARRRRRAGTLLEIEICGGGAAPACLRARPSARLRAPRGRASAPAGPRTAPARTAALPRRPAACRSAS
jgi:hypothetical protein